MRWGLNMFLTRLKRAEVALSIAIVLANTALAIAAEQSITPMAGTECEAMARKISQAVGIKLGTKVGGPDFVADFLPGVHGNACFVASRWRRRCTVAKPCHWANPRAPGAARPYISFASSES
jgi:hypothetical protein